MTNDSGQGLVVAARQPVDEATLAGLREQDWKELHWRLRSLAQQRVALEAQESSLLIEAEESQLYRRLGYSTMIEYMERELHWGPHAANERLRVARELIALPLIADQFRRGELCFSAVRELSRVATPQNEHEFLVEAQGKTARDVERMVAGLKRGDSPKDEPDPRLIKKRIVLEVSVPVYARYRRTRTELDKERGERMSDDEVLDRWLREAGAGPGEVSKPAVQVALTTCKACKRHFVNVGGEQLPIDEATADLLICDSEFIGDLESNAHTRPSSHIPNAIRRKVMHRDGYACVVPGCRATRNLDVHHLEHQACGGEHEVENCCTLCGGHHAQNHDGRLVITGNAPDLKFAWRPDDGVDTATTEPVLEFVDIEDDPVPRGTIPAPRSGSSSG